MRHLKKLEEEELIKGEDNRRKDSQNLRKKIIRND